jgi:Fuc2NAc and GlcNAc transferase
LRFETVAVCVGALVASAVLTGLVRRFALAHGVLDVPNERSSHRTATPRAGGVSMVLTVTAALIALEFVGTLQKGLFLAFLGSIVVAAVGIVDDRVTVAPSVKLAIHIAAAVWAVAWLGGLPPIRVGSQIVHLGWAGHLLAVLAIVWTLNLFNFMDGIDGIAASEAMFIGLSAALLGLIGGGATDVSTLGVVLAAACAGFLSWNWPPAKIFMGDVGSGYLGYAIAVLALAAARENPVALWVWLILGGIFFVDSTVTLLRRVVRGDRVHQAHRSHAYQWLARRWGSHRRVTVAVMMLNLIWLLPCAFLVTLHPDHAVAIVVVALAPLVALALAAGSGRRESENSKTEMT